jgi:hypothetical protein
MDIFEYMRIPTKLFPHEIIEQYNLLPLVSDGHIYIEVQKGMYGLPQAGILANQLPAPRLAIHGYHQTTTLECTTLVQSTPTISLLHLKLTALFQKC